MLEGSQNWTHRALAAEGDGRVALCNRDLWGMRRRIEAATGLEATPALLGAGGASHVAVWGRGRLTTLSVARRARAGLLHVEDAFLRSVEPGRHALTVGLAVDPEGWHGDPARPGRLDRLIDLRMQDRRSKRDGGQVAEAMRRLRLSKYLLPGGPQPRIPRGAVILADQAPGDAALGGAGRPFFLRMLRTVLAEHPDAPVLIRSHPAAPTGHLTPAVLLHAARRSRRIASALREGRLGFLPAAAAPASVFQGAARLHVANSLIGLEALVHGVPVTCHAPGFYAGRGLTDDRFERPGRPATLAAVLAAAYLDHCTWFEPGGDRPVSFFDAGEALRRLADGGPPPPLRRPSRTGFLLAALTGRGA
ncbi:hypothetical protein ACQ5SO_12120 [Rhodovulum sp. DZ06]|uniref:capsular polysaccharide export protein, LipB/KpsS family n=1 Tax=Rhodovulum sp. DZ06 TaxID=3425126 RepID=UPI003D359561